VSEQVPGPAVQVRRADDVVAGTGDILDRKCGRGLTRRQGQGAHAAFQSCDALLEHVVGRIHDARVDVAEFLEREQVGGVLGVAELIRGCLIDRHRNGAGRGVRTPPGV